MKAGLGLMKTVRPICCARGRTTIARDCCNAGAVLRRKFAQRQGLRNRRAGSRDTVAEALVGIADRRMLTVQNTSAKSMYKRLRGDAEAEVVAALPLLSRTLGKYLDRSA